MKPSKLVFYLAHPKEAVIRLLQRNAALFKDDKSFLKLMYLIRFGRKLHLENPVSFNEKLNWMKLHYHNPALHVLADKYDVKRYVADKIGSEYVVRNYGVWDRPDQIDFEKLPDRFVLKCTHDSGGVFICRDKASFDKRPVIASLKKKMSTDYYAPIREWVYKDLCPRVIADELLAAGKSEGVLLDYKFWCFDGEPKYMYITVKDDDVFENFYDMDFNPVGINHGFKRMTPEFGRPVSFEKMKSLARTLSAGLPFVRVDFFEVDGHPYFGEFTFYDWGGMQPFADFRQDIELGQLIKIMESGEHKKD